MSEVFVLDPGRFEDAGVALDAAAAAVAAGELVVLPTETVYGIACRPDDNAATERLFAAKRRPRALNLPVLAESAATAWELGVKTGPAEALAGRFWPGPLTLILGRTERVLGWRLGQRTDSIGLRVPDHPVARGLLQRAGPLAVTSANITGAPPLRHPRALRDTFGSEVSVYLLLDRAPPPGAEPSTVLDLTPPGRTPRLVREGPVRRDDLAGVLSEITGPRRPAVQ